ncbi:MAG: DUF736 domain-containing protein [Alphaproteobacteria bacterium]|nr:DUF736 domain-containing protein [Alphaproteobacteria bacterium]
MPRIGEFHEAEHGLKGHIHTREGKFNIELHRIEGAGADGPHYDVKAPNGAEIGAAWNKVGKTSNETYIRLSVDDMSMPSKIQGNLVKEGNGRYGLIWNRENGQSVSREKQAANEIER